jgi:outer membrane cobalamin receptor
LIAVGRRYFLPQNLEVNALAGYFDHCIAVRKTVPLRFCSLTLAAEALNLAGTNYEIVHSYPMPGRQFRISVTVTI